MSTEAGQHVRPKGADARGKPIIRSKDEQERRQAERLAWLSSRGGAPEKERPRSPERPERPERERSRERDREEKDKGKKKHRRHKHRRRSSLSDSRSRSRDRRRSRSPRRDRDRRRSRSRSDDRFGYSPRRRKGSYDGPGGAVPVLPDSRHRSPAFPAPPFQRRPVELSADAQRKAAEFAAQQRVSALASRAATAYKKSREIHVSGLALGNVPATQEVLTAFFSAALANMQCPSLVSVSPDPPVVSVTSFENGKYSFVELRAQEQATASLTLTGTDVGGRLLVVARPAGFVEPPVLVQLVDQAADAAAEACQQLGVHASSMPPPLPGSSVCVRLDNVATPAEVHDPHALEELRLDMSEEAERFGAVADVSIVAAPDQAAAAEAQPAVYVMYTDPGCAARAQAAFHGRMFDGRPIGARLVWPCEMKPLAAAAPPGDAPPAEQPDAVVGAQPAEAGAGGAPGAGAPAGVGTGAGVEADPRDD